MKKIDLFYLETCPYCIKARQAVAELLEEKPAYKEIEINWIEESQQSELADQYDYYSVPTLFYGREKLYEAKLFDTFEYIKSRIDEAFAYVMKA